MQNSPEERIDQGGCKDDLNDDLQFEDLNLLRELNNFFFSFFFFCSSHSLPGLPLLEEFRNLTNGIDGFTQTTLKLVFDLSEFQKKIPAQMLVC